jgi:hypothetical protein
MALRRQNKAASMNLRPYLKDLPRQRGKRVLFVRVRLLSPIDAAADLL